MLDIAALEALVVKRGPQGATVHLASGEVVEVPGFPVEVMNILGAGDAFAAASSTAVSRAGIGTARPAWATPAAPS